MLDGIVDTRPYIEVDEDHPVLLNEMVRTLTISEQQGAPVQVEIRLDNGAQHAGHGIDFAFEFSDTETLSLGKAFRVLFPARDTEEESGPREVFAGKVSALEYAVDEDGMPELCIFGEDALMAWRMRRSTRSFEGEAIRDMIATLATGTDLADPVADYLEETLVNRHQVNESDLAFLLRVLADHDADAQVVSGGLNIAPRASQERDTLTLELGTQLKSVRVMADLAHQRSAHTLSSFDPVTGSAIFAEMQTESLGPGEGRLASEYLEPFGDTVEHFASAPVPTQEEAQALIDAAGAKAARRFVVARGEAVGNPRLRVGCHVTLEGIGPRFSNTYYVTAARHRYARQGGYVTEFEAECAYFHGEVPQ